MAKRSDALIGEKAKALNYGKAATLTDEKANTLIG
jgi:hypothetical protein